jgi:hypothetical protein
MDKEALFVRRLPEEDVPTPLGTMRVRGLSQAEAHMVEQVKGSEARERRILSLGLLEPALTESEVGQWQRAAPAGEVTKVALAVARLSGMLEGADKAAFQGAGGESGSGVSALPSPETGRDDGGRDGSPDGA